MLHDVGCLPKYLTNYSTDPCARGFCLQLNSPLEICLFEHKQKRDINQMRKKKVLVIKVLQNQTC